MLTKGQKIAARKDVQGAIGVEGFLKILSVEPFKDELGIFDTGGKQRFTVCYRTDLTFAGVGDLPPERRVKEDVAWMSDGERLGNDDDELFGLRADPV